MTWLDPLTPDAERANLAAGLKWTDAPPAPGILTNVGAAWKGVPKGLVEGATFADRVSGAAADVTLHPLFDALGFEPAPPGSVGYRGDPEGDADRAQMVRAMYAREYGLDHATTGLAGQVLYDLGRLVPRTTLGSMAGGPIGGGLAAGAPEALEGYEQQRDLGVDPTTAAGVGATRGLTTGLGALLPGSGLVKGAAGDFAATVGANVGLGIVDRYSTAAILRRGGYEAQAAQYDALDGTAMTVDLVLGAAFFGISRATAPAHTPSRTEVQAALALNLDHHRRTGAGLPTTPADARANGDAIDQALQAVLRGERVNLAETIAGTTLLRPTTPPVDPSLRADLEPALGGRAAVIAAAVDRTIGLESGGKADAKNTRSSATGLGQFIAGTWREVIGKHRPDLLEGRTPAQVLALRTDPTIARELTTRFTEDNADALAAAGVPVDEATLYMAHHFGAAGATRMLQADPTRPVADFLTKAEIKANPHLHGKTVAQAMDDFDARAGREPRVIPPTEPADLSAIDTVPETSVHPTTGAAYATRADLVGMYAKAEQVKPVFDQHVGALARELDGTPDIPALKGLDRARDKIVADYFGDARQIKDLVRATVIVKSAEPDGVERAIAAAVRRLGPPSKVRDGLRGDPSDVGYRDVLMNFTVDGHVVELQFNVPEMAAAKKKAHPLYKEQAAIERQLTNRAATPAEAQRLGELVLQQQRIYGVAWAEARRGWAGPSKGEPSPRSTQPRKASSDMTDPLRENDSAGNRRPPSTSQAVTTQSGVRAAGTSSTSANTVPGGKDSGSFMDSTSGPIVPPINEATGLPQTPAVQAALAAADLDPTLQVVLEDGTTLTAAEALATLAKEQGDLALDQAGLIAAAHCFLRDPG